MAFIFQVTHEGDGTSFNRSETKTHQWAGRWDDFYASQKHPRTWKLRKWLKKSYQRMSLLRR